MRIRLIKKLSEWIDGVDLSGYSVGDGLDLEEPAAALLIAEEWALPERRAHSRECSRQYVSTVSHRHTQALAAERPERSRKHP